MAISLWAVLLSVVSAMAVGMLWYGPLFGKLWLKKMGWDTKSEPELAEMRKSGGPGYAISIVGAALTAVILSLVYDWAVVGASYDGWMLGLALATAGWLAFVVPVEGVTTFFEGRDRTVAIISVTHQLVHFLFIGLWVGLFA